MKLILIVSTLLVSVVLFSVYFKAAVAATSFVALASVASLVR